MWLVFFNIIFNKFLRSTIEPCVVDTFITFEEFREEGKLVEAVDNPAGFADWVHSKLACSNIHGFSSQLCSHHWPNRTPTSWIILHNEFLNRDICLLCNYLQNLSRRSICHVSLIEISLKNYSLIQLGWMLWLMLVWVIWMNCMCHVGRNHKGSLHCYQKIFFGMILLI